VDLPDSAGVVRVIAGSFRDIEGPARTFTPINVWDVRLNQGTDVILDLPRGHTPILVVLSGRIVINGNEPAADAEALLLDRDGESVSISADTNTTMLVLTGEPINEPIVGRGPFVMNSQEEIDQAMSDFRSGRFGRIAA